MRLGLLLTNKKPKLIASSGDSLRESFGKELVALAKEYPKVVVFKIPGKKSSNVSKSFFLSIET